MRRRGQATNALRLSVRGAEVGIATPNPTVPLGAVRLPFVPLEDASG